MRLEGKVAVITGAAKGIGLACAERFSAEGARVVIADVDEAAGQSAAERIDNARFVRCDVARAEDAATLAASAVDAFGAIDVLVNNAGITLAGEFLDVSEAEFDRVLDVNLKGA